MSGIEISAEARAALERRRAMHYGLIDGEPDEVTPHEDACLLADEFVRLAPQLDRYSDETPLTIDLAQDRQPWTVPYSQGVQQAERIVPHILGSHAALHAMKSVGKLAAVFESLDHSGNGLTDEQLQVIRDMSADLLTAALRMANLYSFRLADELIRAASRGEELRCAASSRRPEHQPRSGREPNMTNDRLAKEIAEYVVGRLVHKSFQSPQLLQEVEGRILFTVQAGEPPNFSQQETVLTARPADPQLPSPDEAERLLRLVCEHVCGTPIADQSGELADISLAIESAFFENASPAEPQLDRCRDDIASRLHQQIMNLPCKTSENAYGAYERGHRDARHAAAELVLAALQIQTKGEAT